MLAWSFSQLLERLEEQRKKERAMPPTAQSMQIYLQRSFSSLLWHTSVTRKTSQKRTQTKESEDTNLKGNCQRQILSFDPDAIFSATQGKLFQKLDWKHYESLLNLGFKNKVDKRPLFIGKAIKRHDRGRKVSAVTKGWVQPFSIFFSQEGPIHAVKWAIYVDENKQNQIIPAMKSKGRTMLHH